MYFQETLGFNIQIAIFLFVAINFIGILFSITVKHNPGVAAVSSGKYVIHNCPSGIKLLEERASGLWSGLTSRAEKEHIKHSLTGS